MTDRDIRYSITAEDRFSRTFSNLKRDIGAAREGMGGMVETASRVNVALGAITLGAAGAGGLILGIKQLAHELDALNDAADATGSTVENLSALERVARLNGESLDIVSTSVVKLNKVLNEAKPDSPITAALKQIGLDAARLREMDPSEAVRQVALALAGFQDDGNKARLILELFGKSAQQLAPFLKDLAEAGELNATVTAEQAQAAERFNKELFKLSTAANDAARGVANALLPGINQLFDALAGRGVGGDSPINSLLVVPLQTVSVLAANVGFVLKGMGTEIGGLAAQAAALMSGDVKGALRIGDLMKQDAKQARSEFDALERRLMNIGRVVGKADYQDPWLTRMEGGPRRIGPPADQTNPQAPAKASEAEKYLEQLDRQLDKLRDLTALQQLEADIANKRIDGLTPKLERELRLAAQRVDLQRQINAEIEREAGFQRLLSDKDQRDLDEVQRLLSQTETGRLQSLESQADKLLDFSRRIGEDDPRQKQVLEAMRRLREEAAKIVAPVEPAVDAYGKLADAIEKSMDRSTSAIIDMAITGKGSVSDLGRAFSYDVLRELIEEPVRQVMKGVAKEIASVLKGQGGSFLDFFKFGGSGGGFDLLGSISSFFGGFTGRANGGDVSAGSLVRWKENGREWFVPGSDGSVVNQAQLRAMTSAPVQQTNHIVINGATDPAEVQRRVDAAIARNNARLARSARFGGTMAG